MSRQIQRTPAIRRRKPVNDQSTDNFNIPQPLNNPLYTSTLQTIYLTVPAGLNPKAAFFTSRGNLNKGNCPRSDFPSDDTEGGRKVAIKGASIVSRKKVWLKELQRVECLKDSQLY